jgi:flavin-dependent thymidylate synthase
MRVTLLSCTADALNVLLYTKQTRLRMSPEGLDEIRSWSDERKAEELRYMRNTIQSSWEFVDYIFAIEGVTRAFTHQLVRHRVGTSFAQQAQRVVNMEGFGYLATGSLARDGKSQSRHVIDPDPDGDDESFISRPAAVYDETMSDINASYVALLEEGVKPQDARGILPTNILTNITFKANLRTLHDMALKRLCVKAQGEMQDVFKEIVAAVVREHPWAEPFLRVQCAWNGTCLFPSLPVEDCHVKPWVYDPAAATSYGVSSGVHSPYEGRCATTDEIYAIHRAVRTEIQPTVPPPKMFGAPDIIVPFPVREL